MRVCFTGAPLATPDYRALMKGRHVMFSFAAGNRAVWADLSPFASVVLDSGAYSVWRSGARVDLGRYAECCARLAPSLDWYANLDAIGDWRAGLRNLADLERRGLFPVPVYHLGEPWGLLDDLASGYDRVAIGRGPALSFRRMWRLLEVLFDRFTDASGLPLLRFHGFRMTDRRLMARFPFHSVDSTTWNSGLAWGELPTDSGRARGFSFLTDVTRARVWLEFFDRAPKALRFDRSPAPALQGYRRGALCDYRQAAPGRPPHPPTPTRRRR